MAALRLEWEQRDLEPGTMLWSWPSTTGYVLSVVLIYTHDFFVEVGPLGFMCLDTDEAAGNMGMLDQGEIPCN